jgi:predicted nucleotidyltransferase
MPAQDMLVCMSPDSQTQIGTYISEVVGKLIGGLDPDTGVVRIYAYGSRVRGDWDPGYDLDLLVEVREVAPAVKRRLLDRAWELSLEQGYVISVTIVSQEAFETGPLSISEYARRVREEGVEITA